MPVVFLFATPLEIRAAGWKRWHAGDGIGLEMFFRGEPLDGIIVDVAAEGPADYFQQQYMTGPGGSLHLRADNPGKYLVVARHLWPEGEEGIYDKTSLTATLALMVAR